jgi:hypothetical protein
MRDRHDADATASKASDLCCYSYQPIRLPAVDTLGIRWRQGQLSASDEPIAHLYPLVFQGGTLCCGGTSQTARSRSP